ncbi:MAG: hypothetical protein L7F78_02840, partial [Syntrophales bacterium LBB04]|nr:hypothetical protein [Syntrophales bacterium LBB04]
MQIGNNLLRLDLAQTIVQAYIILNLAWLLKIAIELLLNSAGSSKGQVPRLLIDVVGVMIFIGAVIIIVSFVFDRPVTGLLATSGLIMAILGFALQSTFSNIF